MFTKLALSMGRIRNRPEKVGNSKSYKSIALYLSAAKTTSPCQQVSRRLSNEKTKQVERLIKLPEQMAHNSKRNN